MSVGSYYINSRIPVNGIVQHPILGRPFPLPREDACNNPTTPRTGLLRQLKIEVCITFILTKKPLDYSIILNSIRETLLQASQKVVDCMGWLGMSCNMHT